MKGSGGALERRNGRVRRGVVCVAFAVLAPCAGAGSVQAQAQAQAQTAMHVLVVTGLSGEARFATAYADAGAALVETAMGEWGTAPGNVVWLAESTAVHASVKARSTREELEREVRAIVARASADDAVLIVFFGHGSFQGGETRINLPGPDITGGELAALLAPLHEQRVAVVNTASASGGFIQDLAAPNRIVITATKSGLEQNETVFGKHFAAALTGSDADVNQDGRVSLLEAFDYARAEVDREYDRASKLLTEHAVLDAVGDGTGVSETDSSTPHGRVASTFHFGPAGGAAAADASPELRALYQTRDRLQAQLDVLRGRRADMPEAEYEAALEVLLVDIARTAQAIRRLEGGGT